MTRKILKELEEKRLLNKKSLAVLIDPDEMDNMDRLYKLIDLSTEANVDYVFVGGSVITGNDTGKLICLLKSRLKTPVICFPGNNLQLDFQADAILFLSLISGRNPEYLIGQHVPVARKLKKSNMEVIPTGYILIDGGKPTSVSYISFTQPVPGDKTSIAISTAVAGELLGMKVIYLEAGSGALHPVPEVMIKEVRKEIDIPLIVGGGIDSTEKALKALRSGADVIVVGNQLENNPYFLKDLSGTIQEFNQALNIHQ